jgi:hypothetical protein
MTSARYQRTAAAAFMFAVASCALCLLIARLVFASGSQRLGFYIGLTGCALPALSLAGCALWLRKKREAGDAAASVPWLRPLLLLSLGLVGFVFLLTRLQ